MRFPVTALATNLSNLCNKVKESSTNGKWKDVLCQYREITRVGAPLRDHTIFSHVLKACIPLSFQVGESVHASLIKQGFESFPSVGNSLLDFYVKSGELDAFNHIEAKDSVSWNIIIRGHLDRGASKEGLKLFNQARESGFEPNVSTLVLILQKYRSFKAFDDGHRFHGYLIRSGLCSVLSVQNSLLGMYTDIGMDCAENLFDEMHEKDVISWSVMIGGYVHRNEVMRALEMFRQMVSESGVDADGQTMVSILKGCAKLADLKMGKSIHGFIVPRGLNYDTFVGNTLVDFYSKCGDVDSGGVAFNETPCKNIVTWNSMLSGYIHNDNHLEALALFASMGKSGVDADEVTLVNLLGICRALGNLHCCRSVHARVIRRDLQLNGVVMNSLIDAYAKCGQIDLSWQVFCKITARDADARDAIAWSTMISGFTHCGMPDEAISLYREMQLSRCDQNPVALLNLLEACAAAAEIVYSKWAHGIAVQMGLASDVVVGTTIIDMYGKCGAIEMSRKAFDQISLKNIFSWSAMIAAYGLNGLPRDALSLFSEMEGSGLKGNSVTYLAVLSACCHGGLVDEGILFFKGLVKNHGDEVKAEHYACLVDLLARAGKLNDAMEVIKSGTKQLGASAWGAVLSACRDNENGRLTAGVLSRVLELEPSGSAGYVLGSNVYANVGAWTDACGLRRLMKERGVKVVPGYSIVRLNKKSYSFTAGDKYDNPLGWVVCPVVEQLHSCMRMDFGARMLVT